MPAKVIKLHTKKRRPAVVGAAQPQQPGGIMGQIIVAVVSGVIIALMLRKTNGRR